MLTLVAKSTADVPGFSPVRGELSKLVDNCLEELSSFDRLSGRSLNAVRTLEGLVRLPLAAWPEDATQWFSSLGTEVRRAPKVLTLDVFRLRFGGQSTVSKECISALSKVLGTFGVGLEPIELAAKKVIFTVERVALFFDSGAGGHVLGSQDVRTYHSVVNLAIALAMFGGEMTTEDKEAIAAEIKSWRELTPGQVARLSARLDVVRGDDVDVKFALKHLAELDKETRLESLNFLTRLAFRDFDSTRARSGAFNQYRTALAPGPITQAQHAAPPVPAARNAAASSTVTRPSPRSKAAPKRLTLDPVRIALVQQDTAKVAMLLHGVFTDDAGQADSKPPSTAANQVQIAPSAFALDPTHRELLGHLLGRDSWALRELQTLVAQHELMLDGAMETLNEAVFDAFGVCLVEGDDPLEVNCDVRPLILDAMSAASSRTPG